MHVLLLNSKGPGGGGAHQAFQLVRYLRERGCTVTFASRRHEHWRETCKRLDIPLLELPLRSVFDLGSVRAIKRFVSEQKVDIIQVQKGTEFALALPAAYRNPHVGFVVYRGVSFPLDVFNKQKYKLSRVDRVVTVADFTTQQLVNAGLPAEKVTTIYGGVDTGRFDVAEAEITAVREEFGLGEHHPVIIMVAHLRTWKRHEDLLQAAAVLLPDYPKLRVLCVGRIYEVVLGPLRQQAAQLGLGEHVTFTGERTDVPALLANATVSVNCADAGEGLTGALRESLFMNVPVVATRTAGNTEIISHEKTGLLVDPREPVSLASAIRRYLEETKLASRLATEGNSLVRARFTADAQVEAYMSLYRDILDKRRATTG